jgi:Phosphotransferase enzyme family
VDIGVVLGAVNAELGGRWRLERRLAGGWNEGAYLLIGGGGSRVVLKWRASDPERLLGAREWVEAARARGWPAPEWLATGQAATGEAWVVQEFIDGRTPPRLDDFVAEQMTWILGLEEAMFSGQTDGWGQWAAGVVFEDWDGLRDRVAAGVPGGSRIVAAVDAISGACPPGPLSGQDLVHGNFNLANGLTGISHCVTDLDVGEPYIANRCAVLARNRRLDLTSGPHLFTLRDRHSSPGEARTAANLRS